MKQNVGMIDKIIRTTLGLAILSLVFLGPQTAWGYLGLIGILSAASGFCPIYAVYNKRREMKASAAELEKECWDREGRWGLSPENDKILKTGEK